MGSAVLRACVIAGFFGLGCGGADGGGRTNVARPAPAAAEADAAESKASPEATVASVVKPKMAAEPEAAVLTAPPPRVANAVELAVYASGLHRPVALEDAPGDATGRLFVAEEGGRIVILDNGRASPQPFLDISKQVSRRHEEQGLLGLAFHPRFAKNRKLYVNYTARDKSTRIVEYRASAGNPDRAEPSSARELLRIEQPFRNHNGGHVAFGPDGKLYVGTGDGGAAGDPHDNAQNRKSLLGKMLRLDVDAARPSPQIIQTGLRNPWRYAFDRKTGDLYIADVGQDKWEWVLVVGRGNIEGHNFGWNITEGMHCYKGRRCKRRGITPPVLEYDHRTGCSITGGYVYRGKALPELEGAYFYADYCTGLLRSFRWRNGRAVNLWDWKRVLDPESMLGALSSFGQDEDGELYLLALHGEIYKLVRS